MALTIMLRVCPTGARSEVAADAESVAAVWRDARSRWMGPGVEQVLRSSPAWPDPSCNRPRAERF
jgi:hypothetical protein